MDFQTNTSADFRTSKYPSHPQIIAINRFSLFASYIRNSDLVGTGNA